MSTRPGLTALRAMAIRRRAREHRIPTNVKIEILVVGIVLGALAVAAYFVITIN